MSDEEDVVEVEPVFSYPKGFQDDDLPHKGVFSPSQFNTTRKCMKQYYYIYVLGARRKPAGIKMLQGSSLHWGAYNTHMATIKTGKPLVYKEALQTVVDHFDKNCGEAEDLEQPIGAYKDNTARVFHAYYQQAIPKIHPVKAEEKFATMFGTVPVVGIIDLVDKLPALDVLPEMQGQPLPGIEVVSDLKFTGKRWAPQRIRHETQLTFYAHVIGTPNVRVDFLLDLKKGAEYAPEKAIRTPQDVKVLIEDVEEIVSIIKKGDFPRCDPTQWWCCPERCGFYSDCRGPK